MKSFEGVQPIEKTETIEGRRLRINNEIQMKSFEGVQPIEKTETIEGRRLRINNEIQKRLWGLMCSPDEGQKGIFNWIEHFSPSFEIVFKEVLARDPDFLDKWDSRETERLNASEFFVDELKKLESSPIERAA